MELSIEELLAGLQEAQDAKSTVKLSDRNVVELVNKLKELNLLTDLLYTVNGKEYLTRDRVKAEVSAAVRSAGGRIALVDLPPLLGVDLVHCEVAAAAIVEESKGETLLAQGEVITTQYFDSLALEVDEDLQEAGAVSLAELARKSHLGADLLLSNLSFRMGAAIRGRLEGGLLYTQAHVNRIKARLRGALRGCTSPTLVSDILGKLTAKQGCGGSMDVDPKLITAVVEELVAEGALKGALKGGGTSWVPDIYKSAQAGAVRTFFEQNGYIDYAHASKMGLPSNASAAKVELTSLLPGGLPLSSAIVAPALIDQLDASVEEALSSESWVDVLPMVPPVLSVDDAASLLSHCPAVKAMGSSKQGGVMLASTCVFSSAFIKDLSQKYAVEARAGAGAAAAERRQASTRATGSSAETGSSAGKGKTAKGGKAESMAADEDDDDWDAGAKKGRKGGKSSKKAGKGAAGGKPGAKSSKQEEKGGNCDDPSEVTKLRAPTASKVSAKLQEWVEELAGPAGDADVIADEVASLILHDAVMEYERALTAAFTAGADERRRRRDDIAKLLENSASRLALFAKGVSVLEGAEDAEELGVVVGRHVLRAAAPETVDLLLRYEELQADEVALPKDPKPVLGLSPAERKAIISVLPADLRHSSTVLVDTLNGSDLTKMQSCLDDAASAAGLRIKRFDKKGEKTAVAEMRQTMLGQLMPETDPANALALVVPLLFIKATGKLISLPGRAMTGVIAFIKPSLSEEVHQLLLSYHHDVVTYLKSKSESPDAEARNRLEAALPRLKALCSGEDSALMTQSDA